MCFIHVFGKNILSHGSLKRKKVALKRKKVATVNICLE